MNYTQDRIKAEIERISKLPFLGHEDVALRDAIIDIRDFLKERLAFVEACGELGLADAEAWSPAEALFRYAEKRDEETYYALAHHRRGWLAPK